MRAMTLQAKMILLLIKNKIQIAKAQLQKPMIQPYLKAWLQNKRRILEKSFKDKERRKIRKVLLK